MSIHHYNPRHRYRTRNIQRWNKTILLCSMMAGCFALGFFIGGQNAVVQNGTLKLEVEEITAKITALQDELISVRAEAQTSVSRYEQLKTQYDKEVPQDGPLRDVIDIVKKQIADGMAPERLAFVLRSARPPRNCSDPSSKRFMVKTPAYNGSDSVVSVGEGAVIVSGTGVSARSKTGEAESWFDPSQAVNITFRTAGGENERKSATLPMQHSVIAKGREYRFTLSESEKSFVKVTFDSCDYP